MIDLKELRIGNAVNSTIEIGNYWAIFVKETDFSGNYKMFNPIKLTESIIREFCYNETKVLGMYRLQVNNNYSISFSIDNDMIYIGDDIEIRISETPLHTLQNICLDLFKYELKITI